MASRQACGEVPDIFFIAGGIVRRIGDQHDDLHDAIKAATSLGENPDDHGKGLPHLLLRGGTPHDAACPIVRGAVARDEQQAAGPFGGAEGAALVGIGLVDEVDHGVCPRGDDGRGPPKAQAAISGLTAPERPDSQTAIKGVWLAGPV